MDPVQNKGERWPTSAEVAAPEMQILYRDCLTRLRWAKRRDRVI
jgi:hypothetical protein